MAWERKLCQPLSVRLAQWLNDTTDAERDCKAAAVLLRILACDPEGHAAILKHARRCKPQEANRLYEYAAFGTNFWWDFQSDLAYSTKSHTLPSHSGLGFWKVHHNMDQAQLSEQVVTYTRIAKAAQHYGAVRDLQGQNITNEWAIKMVTAVLQSHAEKHFRSYSQYADEVIKQLQTSVAHKTDPQ